MFQLTPPPLPENITTIPAISSATSSEPPIPPPQMDAGLSPVFPPLPPDDRPALGYTVFISLPKEEGPKKTERVVKKPYRNATKHSKVKGILGVISSDSSSSIDSSSR